MRDFRHCRFAWEKVHTLYVDRVRAFYVGKSQVLYVLSGLYVEVIPIVYVKKSSLFRHCTYVGRVQKLCVRKSPLNICLESPGTA